jgi:lycopene beta-cyclase
MSTSLYQYQYYDYRYDYDYVFTGAGAAGLSLIMRMLKSGRFKDKTFLLVDRDRKEDNDRTWCFWEAGKGFFEPVVHKRWDYMWFHGDGFSKKYKIRPYQYKMIRGKDFYSYCLDYIKQQENVRLLFEPIKQITNLERTAMLEIENGERYYAREWLFNSIPFEKIPKNEQTQTLLQHFKGWFVETDAPAFDPAACTLMDFRVGQEHGTTFVYTMPLDERHALVEYTLFSESLLQDEQYEQGLEAYLRDYLKLENYTVTEKEFGVIPMTSHQFDPGENRIVNIGTTGGQTKASSGYTFQFIQQHSADILYSLDMYRHPRPESMHSGRFGFYDRVLLDVLVHGELTGKQIFTRMFRRNSPQRIFRFLDNITYLVEDLMVIGSLPTMPFFRAARRVFQR